MQRLYARFLAPITGLKIKLLLAPVSWSLQPWSRQSSYFLRRSQDYCFKFALISLVKVYLHYRSSRRICSVWKGALSNFAKFIEKQLCQSLFFNKVGCLCNFIKKILWHRCFPVNFAKFIWTPILQNISGWLLLALDVKKVDRKKIKRAIFVLKIY